MRPSAGLVQGRGRGEEGGDAECMSSGADPDEEEGWPGKYLKRDKRPIKQPYYVKEDLQ